MSRTAAIDYAAQFFDDGTFLQLLSEAVARPTQSQIADCMPELYSYLSDFIGPYLQTLGFTFEIHDNPIEGYSPFMIAQRIESSELPTVLCYGHGDVVSGRPEQWREGLSPWKIVTVGERWYGRGTADNKAQHLINLAAFSQVIRSREGKVGFNFKLLLEMGEENGSPGLQEFCKARASELHADVFIASDGPRMNAKSPTLFLGSRGVFNFKLSVDYGKGAHHSGNWGGLLKNPGIVLANALACLVDKDGVVKAPGLMPEAVPEQVRKSVVDLDLGGQPGDPAIDLEWGQPGLTSGEKVYGWNTLDVLAFKTGNPEFPVHAIPASAVAHCHMRYVVGTDPTTFVACVEDHLRTHGFSDVKVEEDASHAMKATRLDPNNPWVGWAMSSLHDTTGKPATLLPNLGGSIPNDAFSEVLGLPTVWVPHSYPACSQHAPNEHVLAPIMRESLQIMAGLFWDMGAHGIRLRQEAAAYTQI
jgi:acetylornithine deacetylase/succinyl-diaminopimelate desuccinylase-like protein